MAFIESAMHTTIYVQRPPRDDDRVNNTQFQYSREIRMNKWIALGVAVALVTGAACATSTRNAAGREMATALYHAHAVQKMTTVANAQLHLHHVINCLVGVSGAGYSAAAERLSGMPCKDLGRGAIADSASSGPRHLALEAALRDAQAGAQANQLKRIHAVTAKAIAALGRAQQAANSHAADAARG